MADDATDDELEADLEAEDFGGDDVEDDGSPLPPPPPPPAQYQPSPPPPELVAIAGKIRATSDNLEMQALVHAALCASVADVMQDDKISAAERRRELRTIAAAAAKCFPYRRLYEAEQLIKADRAELENRRRERAGARLEKRKVSGGGKVAPIRGAAIPSTDTDSTDGIES